MVRKKGGGRGREGRRVGRESTPPPTSGEETWYRTNAAEQWAPLAYLLVQSMQFFLHRKRESTPPLPQLQMKKAIIYTAELWAPFAYFRVNAIFFFIERERAHTTPPPTSVDKSCYKCSGIVSSCEWNWAYFRYNPIMFFIESWATFPSINRKG